MKSLARWRLLTLFRSGAISMGMGTGAVPVAQAHGDTRAAPHHVWEAWNLDPTIVVGLILGAWLYARGVTALWRCAGRERGIRGWQVGAFASGWLVLVIALVSPLDTLSGVFFSAHMAQHVLLTLVAAPLLVLGSPLIPYLWSMPQPWRRDLARWHRRQAPRLLQRLLTQPAVVWILYAVVLWIWHAPALYEMALRVDIVHAVEHVSFLGTAFLFWWLLIQPHGRRHLSHGAAILYLFAAAMQGMALSLLMTLSATPWYTTYREIAVMRGIDPIEDQQLAGWVMWTPMSAVYLIAALALFAAWLRLAERQTARTEQPVPPVVAS